MSALDSSPITELTGKATQTLQKDFGPDSFVRTVALVVEIDCGNFTTFHIEASDDRSWARIGFLDQAIRVLESLEYRTEEAE